jgi:Serine dehydrogenase proteinase
MAESEFLRMLKEKFGAAFGKEPTDLVAYIGGVNEEGCRLLHEAASSVGRAPRVVIWITTTGGDANAAYRMASCLQRNYKRVVGYVSTMCKSAGTLMAIGAHDLIIDDDAELGPLDIQVQKRDELWEYGSGLDSLEALEVLKTHSLSSFRDHVLEMRQNGIPTKIASEVAKALTLGILAPIAGHLDPVSLGETNRRMRIAEEYSKRLDKHADNIKSYDALGELLTGYPSHGFVINREEAKTLFTRVREPSSEEKHLFQSLAEPFRIGRKSASADNPRVINFTRLINKIVVEDATGETNGNDSGIEEGQSVQPQPGAQKDEQEGGGDGKATGEQGQA